MDIDPTKPVVLVVEDDVTVAALLAALLADTPAYQALVVGTAAQALAVIQQVQVALILLELDLPGLDGAQLYDLLQAGPAARAIPVLFLTTNPADPRLQARGVRPVLVQPFRADTVRRRVAHLLAAPAHQGGPS